LFDLLKARPRLSRLNGTSLAKMVAQPSWALNCGWMIGLVVILAWFSMELMTLPSLRLLSKPRPLLVLSQVKVIDS